MKPELKIVKIGGRLIEEEKLLQEFLSDFSRMEGPKILVHGGGILATQLSEKLGFPTTMLNGRRITDENALKVIGENLADTVEARELFYREARMASSVNHPNIASVVDFGEDSELGAEELSVSIGTLLPQVAAVEVVGVGTCGPAGADGP